MQSIRCAKGLGRALVAAAMIPSGFPALARAQEGSVIPLPAAALDGGPAVSRALAERRSTRELASGALPLADVAQLLWAAQGITRPMSEPEGWPYGEWGGGLRTAPSAGALYPLEVYLLAGNVDGLEAGLYRYRPREHGLQRVGGAGRPALAGAALGQRAILDAAAVLVIAAVYSRTETRYGDRTERYVHMEVGAAAENVYLQATALGLGTVLIGAFRDGAVAAALGLPADHAPLAILPVGRPADPS